MPLFSRVINVDGVKTDTHNCLTEQLVPHYIREKGEQGLLGYQEAIVDMTFIVRDICREATTLDELKAGLDDFAVKQTEFVNRTTEKYGKGPKLPEHKR